MTSNFRVDVNTVSVRNERTLTVDYSVKTLAQVDTLEKAFFKSLVFVQGKNSSDFPRADTAQSILIYEKGELVAMAALENGNPNWLKSPTLGDIHQWTNEVTENLRKIEENDLNPHAGESKDPSAFQRCVNLITLAKEKLMTLHYPRSCDEVYETLKRVEKRMAENNNLHQNIFELNR